LPAELSGADLDRLAVVLDEADITRVLMRYCRGIDRRDYELVRSCYHPGARDDHGPYKGDVEGFLTWVAARHATIEQCVHMIGNVLIEVHGDVAVSEAYYTSFQCEGRSFAHGGGRYVDRFERRHGGPWKIAERLVVVEFGRLIDGRNLDIDPICVMAARSRDDALYRVLSAVQPPAGGLDAGQPGTGQAPR